MVRILVCELPLIVAVCLVAADTVYGFQTVGVEYESRRTGIPVLSGEFGGVTRSFLLADTGGEGCTINMGGSMEKLIGYDIFRHKITAFSGTSTAMFYRDVPTSIAGLSTKKLALAQVDLSPMSAILDRHLDGIIGMHYLKDYVLEYSAADGCRLLDHVPEPDNAAIVLPLRNAQVLPEIEIEIAGIGKRWLLLDTGSTGGLCLNAKHYGLLKRMGHLVTATNQVGVDGQGKTVASKGAIIRWIRIGDVEFRNAPTTEIPVESIGMELLHHFRIVLDFSGNQAFLYFDGPEKVCLPPRNASGMAVNNKTNGRLGILLIRDGSPAEELGLQVGDEITDIDGIKPESLSYWEIYDILGQAGKTIPLTVVRDGKVRKVQMTLRHHMPFPPEWPPEKPAFNPDP